MTITAPETVTTVPAVKGSVRAVDLTAALKSVLPFAGTDLTVPMLCHVNMVAADGKLTMMTTDRYTAGRYVIEYEGEPFVAMVHTADVKNILTVIKEQSKGVLPAELTVDGGKLTVTTFTGSTTVALGDSDFPKLASLFPDAANSSLPEGRTAFDARYIAKFAKVVAMEGKTEPMQVYLFAPLKPVLVKIGDAFDGIIMPMRKAGVSVPKD